MAVESENVEKVMEWLAEGGSARSAYAAAETLVEKLAALVFDGEQDWPDNADRVDRYRDDLRAWFANDGGSESQFVELTGLDADPGVFIDWFLPVVTAWEDQGTQVDPDVAHHGEDDEAGLQNPSWDGTPGTEFYRFDEATQEYSYADSSDSAQWLTYEQRRYSEPVRDENYGLDYRYDNRDQGYEWFDEAAGTWKDQAWADRYAAGNEGSDAETSEAAEPAWDESWSMFYRTGPGGTYEYADAVTVGDRSSGCGEVWISREQALARDEQALARDAEDPMAWVRDGLGSRAYTLFGDSWSSELRARLDGRWGAGWEQNPDEHKAAWLGELLTEWEQAAEAQSTPSQDIMSAVEAEVAAAVAEIDGAENLTEQELAEIKAELVAELSGMPATAKPEGA